MLIALTSLRTYFWAKTSGFHSVEAVDVVGVRGADLLVLEEGVIHILLLNKPVLKAVCEQEGA